MKIYAWNDNKNAQLKAERGISFEEVSIWEANNVTKRVKLDREEREVLSSYERGEWQSVADSEHRREQYRDYATAALEAEGLVSISLPEKDLAVIRRKAAQAGVSYQTLIADIVHRFASGQLGEK